MPQCHSQRECSLSSHCVSLFHCALILPFHLFCEKGQIRVWSLTFTFPEKVGLKVGEPGLLPLRGLPYSSEMKLNLSPWSISRDDQGKRARAKVIPLDFSLKHGKHNQLPHPRPRGSKQPWRVGLRVGGLRGCLNSSSGAARPAGCTP